jgi:hypothetical protein
VPFPDETLKKYNPRLVDNITAIILQVQLCENIMYFWLLVRSFDNRNVLVEISLLFEDLEVLVKGIQILN